MLTTNENIVTSFTGYFLTHTVDVNTVWMQTGNNSDKTSRTNSSNSTVLHVLATHIFPQFGFTLLQSKFNLQLKTSRNDLTSQSQP